MDSDERKKRLKKRNDTLMTASAKLQNIRWILDDLQVYLGRSPEFKMLDTSIDLMTNKIHDDLSYFERRIEISKDREGVKFMQKALNREKEKNAKLEKKIEEAKTSSGLFIDFVREKLGMK